MRISRLLILVLLLSILSLINPFEVAKTLVIQGAAQAASFNPDPSLVSWLEGKAHQLVSESRSMTTSSDVAPYYPPAGKHPPNPGYLNAFIGDFSLLAVDSHLVPIEEIKEYVRWHLRRQREDGRIAHYITPDGEDTNPPWSQLSGSLSVVNGEYHQSQALDNAFVLAGDASWSDYALQMRIKLAPASRDGGMGSIFRCMDSSNCTRLELKAGSNQIKLWKIVNGSFSNIATATLPFNIQADTWYSIRVESQGDRFTGFIDGIRMLKPPIPASSQEALVAMLEARPGSMMCW